MGVALIFLQQAHWSPFPAFIKGLSSVIYGPIQSCRGELYRIVAFNNTADSFSPVSNELFKGADKEMTTLYSPVAGFLATCHLNFSSKAKVVQPTCLKSWVGEKLKKTGTLLIWAFSLPAFFILQACSTETRYVETHEIPNLKVVFLDEESLHEKWKARTGQPGTEFQPLLTGGMASLKVIKGFYDFTTDTLYCPKWNFEVCGHELHHAALGHFHPPH